MLSERSSVLLVLVDDAHLIDPVNPGKTRCYLKIKLSCILDRVSILKKYRAK